VRLTRDGVKKLVASIMWLYEQSTMLRNYREANFGTSLNEQYSMSANIYLGLAA
jgi:hypothetical protein